MALIEYLHGDGDKETSHMTEDRQNKVEYISEHRRRAVRYRGDTAILTVKHEPIRVQHGLKPYYAIYQIIREGKLVDENDAAWEGHDSWDEAFDAITSLLTEEIDLDRAAESGDDA